MSHQFVRQVPTAGGGLDVGGRGGHFDGQAKGPGERVRVPHNESAGGFTFQDVDGCNRGNNYLETRGPKDFAPFFLFYYFIFFIFFFIFFLFFFSNTNFTFYSTNCFQQEWFAETLCVKKWK